MGVMPGHHEDAVPAAHQQKSTASSQEREQRHRDVGLAREYAVERT
jgi:hypothetical protein